jgi:hypothetical protein
VLCAVGGAAGSMAAAAAAASSTQPSCFERGGGGACDAVSRRLVCARAGGEKGGASEKHTNTRVYDVYTTPRLRDRGAAANANRPPRAYCHFFLGTRIHVCGPAPLSPPSQQKSLGGHKGSITMQSSLLRLGSLTRSRSSSWPARDVPPRRSSTEGAAPASLRIAQEERRGRPASSSLHTCAYVQSVPPLNDARAVVVTSLELPHGGQKQKLRAVLVTTQANCANVVEVIGCD